jgi:hypothetical protein
MMSMYQALGRLCSGLGLTMVLVSCVLFPQHRLLGEVFDVNLQVQCPTRQDPPYGCIEPGKPCEFGNKPGICGLAGNAVNCTCVPISDADA